MKDHDMESDVFVFANLHEVERPHFSVPHGYEYAETLVIVEVSYNS